MKKMMILAVLAMQMNSVCAQQNDFYYAGVKSDTLAAVYKNNELLYTNFEEENRWCWADCMIISNNGDVYYGGAGNSFGYVWKNGEMYFKGDYRSSVEGISYNADEDVLYSVGYIHFEGEHLREGAIWKDVDLWDTFGTSLAYFNDIDFMDGHCYILGTNRMVNGVGDLTIWKDEEPLYVLGRSWEAVGNRSIVCYEGHVYACGIINTGNGHEGKIWKDGEVLYDYGPYANVRDFCIDGEDIYACGEINVENLEQKAVVWKNNEVLYEYDHPTFIEFYTILKVEDDLYFGGAGFYFGKHPDGRQSSNGMLFKNGEAIEIDSECTSVYALAVSQKTSALQETEKSPVMVFPNPAKDRATLGGVDSSEIQIYNIQGQSVRTLTNTNEINVNGLSKGIYLLRTTVREGVTRSTRLAVE